MAGNDDCIAAYGAVQARMAALAADLDEEMASQVVPATPEWRVRDLLAHTVGVAADIVAGRIEGAGSDPWTALQVDARRERRVDQLLEEWEATHPALDEVLAAMEPVQAGQVVFDVTTHEHDLRGALRQPGARDSDGVVIGWTWATGILGQLRDGYGSGALELRTPEGTTVAGSGTPTGAVEADRFELWRAMTGRRSAEQVASWRWEGEPATAQLCLLPARSTPLVE